MPAAKFSPKELERLTALGRACLLDTPGEQAFDDVTELASVCCQTPIALVSLLDSHRQWFKSKVGLDVCQTPREQAFCGYTILGDGVLCIEDATKDPRTADNPLVTGAPLIRFYAGVPVRDPSGHALGTLCVIDQKPRAMTEAMNKTLTALGRQVESLISLRLANMKLREETLVAQRAEHAKSEFLTEVSRQIRAPLQPLLGLAESIQARNARGELVTIGEVFGLMKEHSERVLRALDEVQAACEAGSRHVVRRCEIDLISVLRDLQTAVLPRATAAGLRFGIVAMNSLPRRIETDAARLRQVMSHLLDNAVRYSRQGNVTLALQYDDRLKVLECQVRDDGVGMNAELLARVRKLEPFAIGDGSLSITKQGMGLGLYTAHHALRSLGGTMALDSEEGVGTVARFSIPVGAGRGQQGMITPQQLGAELGGTIHRGAEAA